MVSLCVRMFHNGEHQSVLGLLPAVSIRCVELYRWTSSMWSKLHSPKWLLSLSQCDAGCMRTVIVVRTKFLLRSRMRMWLTPIEAALAIGDGVTSSHRVQTLDPRILRCRRAFCRSRTGPNAVISSPTDSLLTIRSAAWDLCARDDCGRSLFAFDIDLRFPQPHWANCSVEAALSVQEYKIPY